MLRYVWLGGGASFGPGHPSVITVQQIRVKMIYRVEVQDLRSKDVAKTKAVILCIHCLRPTDAPEGDHVFPSSWYPDTTPSTVQRWTAPSCAKCNREFGQMEKDLLVRLVGCIDPKSSAVSGLYARTFRALGIGTTGLEASEQECRDKLRTQLRSELMPTAETAQLPGAIPGLGPPEQAEHSIPIPFAALSIMAEKIARGCEYRYKNRKRLVVPPYDVLTAIRDTDFIPEPFASGTKLLDFGPGCQIRRLTFIEDANTVWYFITIWQALNIHVRIELETELMKVAPQYQRVQGIGPTQERMMEVPPYLRAFNS